jgi:hypothetical protein
MLLYLWCTVSFQGSFFFVLFFAAPNVIGDAYESTAFLQQAYG